MKETMQSESLTSKICAPFWDMTHPKKTPLQISRETIKAMIVDAEESYCDEFDEGNTIQSMWWDGYLRALYRVLEYHEQ
tara:strand:- start:491 stop:727 length:237 start_codon:yes stop_codon:yes gene_type:complete